MHILSLIKDKEPLRDFNYDQRIASIMQGVKSAQDKAYDLSMRENRKGNISKSVYYLTLADAYGDILQIKDDLKESQKDT